MPWQEDSPLAVGVGTAAAYLQGKKAKQDETYQRQQDAINNAATQAATQSAVLQNEQVQRQMSLVGRNYGFDPKVYAKMVNPDERTRYIQAAQARAMQAGDTQSAQTLGQMATAVPLGAQRISEAGYNTARADYERWRPQYDKQILSLRKYGIDKTYTARIQDIAGRISAAQIRAATGSNAQSSNDTRLAIAALTYERMQQGMDETTARQEALDEYNRNWTAYLTNEKGIQAGNDPIPGAPTTPPEMPSFTINAVGSSPLDAALMAAIAKAFGQPPPSTGGGGTPPKPVSTSGEGQPAPPGAKPGQVFKYKDGKTYVVGKDGKMHAQKANQPGMGFGSI